VRATEPFVSTEILALRAAPRSIGAILIEAGRLKREDAESIVHLQREKGLRFGDAAKKLRLLTDADIEFALSRQFDYPYLQPGENHISHQVISAYDPFCPSAEALRALRSQLMLRWFGNDASRKALTIVSAARNEGRSYIAANLAVVFSQLGKRTLLIDADLRNPCQHQLFGVDNRAGLSRVLSGRAGPETVQRIASLSHLSVLPAGTPPPNPQELLARPVFAELIHQLAAQVDLLLLDTPSAETADAQTVAACTGAVLIVARRNSSRVRRLQAVSDCMVQAKATIVGAVLNAL